MWGSPQCHNVCWLSGSARTLITSLHSPILHCAVDPGYFEGVKKVLHFGTVQKELVDPYCLVSFAGKKGKTPVIWNEQDPEWNHQINLGIRV